MVIIVVALFVAAAAAGTAAAVLLPIRENIGLDAFNRVKFLIPRASAVTTCPLCGGPVINSQAQRPPLIAKIDNEEHARPQSGLREACIVYEVPVEGEISRFSAVYLCKSSHKIGPIRSARFSDIEITKGLKGVLVHCGGTKVTLDRLKENAVEDIDEMINGWAFWRSSGRSAPHNLYTRTSLLWEAEKRKGFLVETDLPRFIFKGKGDISRNPVKTIFIRFSDEYSVSYRYQRKGNRYLRYVSGSPSTDHEDGRIIAPKNVIVQYTFIEQTSFVEDVVGSKSLQPHLVGSGKAVVFRDGLEVQAKWYKPSRDEPTKYLDSSGKEIVFNEGQTWIEIVPADRPIKVSK